MLSLKDQVDVLRQECDLLSNQNRDSLLRLRDVESAYEGTLPSAGFVEDILKEIETLEKGCEGKASEVEVSEGKLRSLQDVDMLVKECEECCREEESLQAKCKQLQLSRNKRLMAESQLQEKLSKDQEDLRSLTKEKARLTIEISGLERSIQKTQDLYDERMVRFSETDANYRLALNKVGNRRSQDDLLSTLPQEINNLKSDLAQIETQLADGQRKLQALLLENNRLTPMVTALEETLSSRQGSITASEELGELYMQDAKRFRSKVKTYKKLRKIDTRNQKWIDETLALEMENDQLLTSMNNTSEDMRIRVTEMLSNRSMCTVRRNSFIYGGKLAPSLRRALHSKLPEWLDLCDEANAQLYDLNQICRQIRSEMDSVGESDLKSRTF